MFLAGRGIGASHLTELASYVTAPLARAVGASRIAAAWRQVAGPDWISANSVLASAGSLPASTFPRSRTLSPSTTPTRTVRSFGTENVAYLIVSLILSKSLDSAQ